MIPLGLVALLAIGLGPRAVRAEDATALYARHCAGCHGAAGRGDGPASGLLSPPPRDFTSGVYKFRSTPSGTLPALDDVARSIRAGLPGTSMPGFEGILSRDAIEALARFVRQWAPPGARAGAPILLGVAPHPSPAAIARGKRLYARAECVTCHRADGRSAGWRPEREGPGGPSPPTDLTAPWTFRGGSDAVAVARRVLTGLDGSRMPGYAGVLTAAQAWEVAYYVGTLARPPIWKAGDRAAVRAGGEASDRLERGRTLVNAMLCPLCHTPINAETGAYDPSHFLAGGMRVSAYPWGVWYSRNLTPDRDTGLGAWSEAEIITAVTRGVARDGRRLDPRAMPWPWFSRLTEADARAVAVYLKALPPVRNAVPAPEPVPVGEAVGGKLLALFGAELAVEFWGGNTASDAALRGRLPAPSRRRAARGIGWGSLRLSAVAAALGCRARGCRWPWLVGGCVGFVAWGVLAIWPPLAFMSPDVTTRWLFLGTPTLPASLTGSARALAERGEYLVTVAPCGLCHTPAGAFVGFYTGRTLAGGMEGRWRVYGSATSTNLTSHGRDGIGAVPDEVLLRAVRSGIGRDGRAMHWQAMPWDIFSHWPEEDLRAMIAYLRVVRAVPGRVPPPRGARPQDPLADSFFFGDAALRAESGR